MSNQDKHTIRAESGLGISTRALASIAAQIVAVLENAPIVNAPNHEDQHRPTHTAETD